MRTKLFWSTVSCTATEMRGPRNTSSPAWKFWTDSDQAPSKTPSANAPPEPASVVAVYVAFEFQAETATWLTGAPSESTTRPPKRAVTVTGATTTSTVVSLLVTVMVLGGTPG